MPWQGVNESDRQWLIELLKTRSYEKRKVTLASGKESDFFIDCKQTVLTAEGHVLVGSLMFDAIERLYPECEAVAGVELGSCPLASRGLAVSFERGKPMAALYVRKEAKDHGSKRLVENDKSLREGIPVVVMEDVVTTGGSTVKSVEEVKGVGASK